MAAPFIQANTNGKLHSADEPSITPLNRGFLYGDAIYEVWRTYNHAVFGWEEHFTRLESSARALHLQLPWKREEIFSEVRRTAGAYRSATKYAGDLYIRLQVSRGAGPIGLDVDLASRPEFVLLVQPCPGNSAEVLRSGAKLSIAAALRRNPVESLSPAWKTGNYLNNILGLREARARGADDVVMLNLRGEITEAATSNIAFVRDGQVVTPRLEVGILAGITRALLLSRIAGAAGVNASEESLRPADLPQMSECFLLSTSRVVTPIQSIDDQRFKVGPETITSRLNASFVEYMRAYAAAHPEMKV
jgi:branched-chain amino acid aminotransferase